MKHPRILVIRGGAIGDFIMTLPAIGALRERWPEAHIEILGYSHITELARGRHYADATRSIEGRALAGFFVPNGSLDSALVDYFRSFQLAVSYLYDPDRVFAENVIRCGVGQLIEGSPRPSDVPAAQHYCKPLEQLAIYAESLQPKIHLTEADRRWAAEYLEQVGEGPFAAIHPGSGGERKLWDVEKFAELARWLAVDQGYRLLVVQGEADVRVVPALMALLGSLPVRAVQGLTLVQLASVLNRCGVFVGNDSGITHMAAAVGVPTVAMFGPASFPIWEPRGDRVRVVQFGEGDVARAREAIQFVSGAEML
jgi:heptosyltransferase-2